MALTKRQAQVLDFLADFIDENGYCPSYEELARGLNLASLATIHKHIQALEARNYLRRGFNQSRSLEIAQHYMEERRRSRSSKFQAGVPMAGRIAAGKPIEAVASSETLQFSDFTGQGETYSLEVTGDSMIEDHILSGDYVLVEPAPDPGNGDIVVALVNGSDATLKRFYREPDGRIRLQPANAAMAPLFVAPESLQIQGRVLAVLRKYR